MEYLCYRADDASGGRPVAEPVPLGAAPGRAKRAQSAPRSANGGGQLAGARCVTNPTAHPRPRLATIEQVAAYLSIAPRSVWRLIDGGKLAAVRLPGLRRTWVERAQIDALVDSALADARP